MTRAELDMSALTIDATVADIRHGLETAGTITDRYDAGALNFIMRALDRLAAVAKTSLEVRETHAVVFDRPGLPTLSVTQRWINACDDLRLELRK